MKNKWIPTSAAAAITGVTAQTIRNLAKHGVISSRRTQNGNYYVINREVLKYKDEIATIHQGSLDFEQLTASARQHTQELLKVSHQQREELYNLHVFPETIDKIRSFASSILRLYQSQLEQRDYEMIALFLQGNSTNIVSKYHSISRERTRQRWERCLRMIASVKRQDAILEDKIAQQQQEIRRLKALLAKPQNTPSEQLVDPDVLNIPVKDIRFTTRTQNCLKQAHIATIYDLVRTKDRYQLMKVRGMGRKSLCELLDFLSANELNVGMTIAQINTWATQHHDHQFID